MNSEEVLRLRHFYAIIHLEGVIQMKDNKYPVSLFVIGVLMIGGISSFVIIKKKKGNLNKENSAEKEEILENEDSNLNKE